MALVRTRPFGASRYDVPVIGQGTWNLPRSGAPLEEAKRALRAGIELGMVHIDSAEMYGDGASERAIGEAIAGIPRERLFLVSKVLPSNASYEQTIRSCEASLRRLRTEYLDCYLLHWRGAYPLEGTMAALERLVDDGKTRMLGVSNFDVADLKEARSALRTHPLACNQVLYHLEERGAEWGVQPFCALHGIAFVGYSPFGSGDFPSEGTPGGKVLNEIAARHGATPRQVALAFLVRLEGTFTIPKAAHVAHARENAAAASLELGAGDLAAIEAAFPKPGRDEPLAML